MILTIYGTSPQLARLGLLSNPSKSPHPATSRPRPEQNAPRTTFQPSPYRPPPSSSQDHVLPARKTPCTTTTTKSQNTTTTSVTGPQPYAISCRRGLNPSQRRQPTVGLALTRPTLHLTSDLYPLTPLHQDCSSPSILDACFLFSPTDKGRRRSPKHHVNRLPAGVASLSSSALGRQTPSIPPPLSPAWAERPAASDAN